MATLSTDSPILNLPSELKRRVASFLNPRDYAAFHEVVQDMGNVPACIHQGFGNVFLFNNNYRRVVEEGQIITFQGVHHHHGTGLREPVYYDYEDYNSLWDLVD